jgi:hypothetical protein
MSGHPLSLLRIIFGVLVTALVVAGLTTCAVADASAMDARLGSGCVPGLGSARVGLAAGLTRSPAIIDPQARQVLDPYGFTARQPDLRGHYDRHEYQQPNQKFQAPPHERSLRRSAVGGTPSGRGRGAG